MRPRARAPGLNVCADGVVSTILTVGKVSFSDLTFPHDCPPCSRDNLVLVWLCVPSLLSTITKSDQPSHPPHSQGSSSQGNILQGAVCSCSPSHGWPPHCSLACSLVAILIPPPQDREQLPQVQELHSQSWGQQPDQQDPPTKYESPSQSLPPPEATTPTALVLNCLPCPQVTEHCHLLQSPHLQSTGHAGPEQSLLAQDNDPHCLPPC